MVFPDKQNGVLEASHPNYVSQDQLVQYPYSHDGKPVVISPTDYGLNYKPTKMEKTKNGFQKAWFHLRKYLRKRTVWVHELGTIYQDGFYRSTIPSADVLASPRREPIRKLLWCAVLAPLIYFTIIDLTDVIQGYMQYPVIYTYEYKTKDTLEFPDVTICNVNPFLRSMACDNQSLLYKEQKVDADGEQIILPAFCSEPEKMWMCERICGQSEVPRQPNTNDAIIRSKLALWIKEITAFGSSGNQIITDMGHKVPNMVRKCSYASNDDCTNATYRFTEAVSQLYGSCLCFHCENKEGKQMSKKKREEWEKYYEYGTLSSPLSGLVIQLNTELDEYLPTSNEVGFVAMIHEHNKDYLVCQDAIFILPGYTTYIGLNLATTFNLELPYEDGCRAEWPDRLKDGTFEAAIRVIDPSVERQQYSRSMCLEYCEIEYILLKCKCIKLDPAVKIHLDLTENYKYCKSSKKTKCSENAIENKTNMDWQNRCDCRRECETQRYATDVSVAGFVADEINDTGGINGRIKSVIINYY